MAWPSAGIDRCVWQSNVIEYFKGMADEAGVPYQSLINLYLRDCIAQNRKVQIQWPKAA
ncbi:hypothetical protein [Sphaerotilus sp.]|uniref:hypothetical protein n=1 Tax=Sphaerotilus sp. TaxID=2093942 RepID=UPI002ACD8BC7|nr:hypothetical protein [Sphaerotilus sp.]MDZ7855052.1 hypothetical protein [Sphaerotilus sp.]